MLPSVAAAQFTVDASRVTCAEVLVMPPDQSRILDFGRFERNRAIVQKYCEAHKSSALMNAIRLNAW